VLPAARMPPGLVHLGCCCSCRVTQVKAKWCAHLQPPPQLLLVLQLDLTLQVKHSDTITSGLGLSLVQPAGHALC
jgi:hypothetical protein